MSIRDEWRWTDDKGVQRLVRTDELRQAIEDRVLAGSTLVWREGMKDWVAASTLPEFSAAAAKAAESSGEPAEEGSSRPSDVDSDPGSVRSAAGPRLPMRTLVGVPPPSRGGDGKEGAPINVPVGLREKRKRSAVTQAPKFTPPPPKDDDENVAIPKAPRLPDDDDSAKKKRGRTTTFIDKGWDDDDDADTLIKRSDPPPPMPTETRSEGEASADKVTDDKVTDDKTTPDEGASEHAGEAAQPTGGTGPVDASAKRPMKSIPPPVPKRDGSKRPTQRSVPPPPPRRSSRPAPPRRSARKLPPPRGKSMSGAGQSTPPPAGGSLGPAHRPPGPSQRPPLPPQAASNRPPTGPSQRPPPPPRRTTQRWPSKVGPEANTQIADKAEPAGVGSSPADPPQAAKETAEAASKPAAKLGSTRPALRTGSPSAPKLAPGRSPLRRPSSGTASTADKSTGTDGSADNVETANESAPLAQSGDTITMDAVADAAPPAAPTADSAGSDSAGSDSAGSDSAGSDIADPPTLEERPGILDSPFNEETTTKVRESPMQGRVPSTTIKLDASARSALRDATRDGDTTKSSSAAAADQTTPPDAPSAPADAATSRETTGEAAGTASAASEDAASAADASDEAAATSPAPRHESLPPPMDGTSAPPPAGSAEEPSIPPPPRAPMMSEPPGGFDSLMPPGERLKRPVSVPVSSLLASGGVWIFCLVAAFIIGRCSADEEPAPLSKALLAPLQSLTAPQNTAPAQATAVDKPCWVVRNAAKWAPLANKDVPFDMYTTPEGQLELGFAVDEQNARGFSLDPKSLTAEEVFSEEESKERVITRVTPVGRDKGGFFVLSRSAEEDDSSAALPVPADQPFFVRFSGGKALVGPSVEEATTEIWPLGGGDAEITAARTLPTRTGNHVITFRQDGRIFAGYVDGTGKAVGSLGEIAGSGGKVGRPKAGVNGKELAVAFADLPKGDGARWQMRIGRAELGQLPTTATVLEFPAGGPGGDAFAPDMVGLPDGRWLVMWTEGTGPGQRAVRAQTYDPELNPIGDPIALSPPAGSFGQAVLGVVGTYTAAVFLSLGDSGFELYGAVLQCGS